MDLVQLLVLVWRAVVYEPSCIPVCMDEAEVVSETFQCARKKKRLEHLLNCNKFLIFDLKKTIKTNGI